MFGYVKVYQPELKLKDFEQYRGVYCALCKNLRRRYGSVVSWTLNYDFVFLALFRMARSPQCPGFKKSRCHYNPLRRRTCCGTHAGLDSAADAAVLLTCYKLRDTVQDAGLFGRMAARIALVFFRRAHRRAAALQPDFDQLAAQCMQQQAQLERQRTAGIDASADPSAQMLAYLAAQDGGEEQKDLHRFGYCLGRWVYLIDALDDLDQDRKKGNYNPFLLRYAQQSPDEQREAALQVLNLTAAECREAFEKLSLHRFAPILSNVIEYGMPVMQQTAAIPHAQRKKAKRYEGSV